MRLGLSEGALGVLRVPRHGSDTGGLGDAVFVNEMQRFGVIRLSTEMVGADVFSNPIHPRIESGVASETADGAKCTKPCLLRQVLGEFRVCDASVDVTI